VLDGGDGDIGIGATGQTGPVGGHGRQVHFRQITHELADERGGAGDGDVVRADRGQALQRGFDGRGVRVVRDRGGGLPHEGERVVTAGRGTGDGDRLLLIGGDRITGGLLRRGRGSG